MRLRSVHNAWRGSERRTRSVMVVGLAGAMLVAGAAAYAGPGAAAPSSPEEAFTETPSKGADGHDHAHTDLAGVSMAELEKAANPRVGLRPKSGKAAQEARQAIAAGPEASGSWGAVHATAVVPVFSALLPNGKVLMWDSVGDEPTETYPDHTFTRAAVYDPATGESTRIDVQGANIFCAGFVQLSDGRIFVAGGNKDSALNGIKLTHIFDWTTNTWTRGPDMTGERWYPSVAALMDGEAFVIGGGPSQAEVRNTDGSMRQLSGVTAYGSRVYPFVQSGPDGRALVTGPESGLRRLSWWQAGSMENATARDALNRSYASFANYLPNKTLVVGGGVTTVDGKQVPESSTRIVDASGNTLTTTAAASMEFRRRQHNATILADGSVLATGGLSEVTTSDLVSLDKAVYAAERWDPATNAWATLASAAVVRQYHSTALLLPDGRVLTGGGGICGACKQVGYLRKDVEIYSPPYLYAADGSPAVRPTITSAPQTVKIADQFTVRTPNAADIAKVGLIRLGAPTHGADQSQRYLPLSFTTSGDTLTVTSPLNPAEAPPGHYMLFLVNQAGTPAVAPIVQVVSPPAGTATAPAARTGGPAVIAYSDINKGGRAQLLEPGKWQGSRGNLAQVQPLATSSVDVANGYEARLCRTDDLQTCVAYGPGVHNVPPADNDTTRSIVVTPKAGGSTPTGNLLKNPGFESGAVSWTGTTASITQTTSKPARTGTWKAWLGGNGRSSTEYVQQSVAVPAAAVAPTLEFWVRIDTREGTTTRIYDRLRVQIVNGTTTTTIGTYSNLDANSTYVRKTFDLSAYKGKTITVKLVASEDSSLQSSFVVDDTRVTP